ncbi:hypothetical protein Tco_0775299, partial [Tanacetum coccineum]
MQSIRRIDGVSRVDLNKQVVESDNELESDTEDVLPEVVDPDAVIEEVTGRRRGGGRGEWAVGSEVVDGGVGAGREGVRVWVPGRRGGGGWRGELCRRWETGEREGVMVRWGLWSGGDGRDGWSGLGEGSRRTGSGEAWGRAGGEGRWGGVRSMVVDDNGGVRSMVVDDNGGVRWRCCDDGGRSVNETNQTTILSVTSK